MKPLNEQTIKRLQKLAGISEIKIETPHPNPRLDLKGNLSVEDFKGQLPDIVEVNYKHSKFLCGLSGADSIQIYPPPLEDGITADPKAVTIIQDMIDYGFNHRVIDDTINLVAIVAKFGDVTYNGVSLKDYEIPDWWG